MTSTRYSFLVAALLLGFLQPVYAQIDRSFGAQTFIMDDDNGHRYHLESPVLTGDRTFIFPSQALVTGDLLIASGANTLGVLSPGADGQVLVLTSSGPVWSSSVPNISSNTLTAGTNGAGGTAGTITINDGGNPGTSGSLTFGADAFNTGNSGLNLGTGNLSAGGSITFSGLPAGVLHAGVGGAITSGAVTNAELTNSSVTLTNGIGVTITGGSLALGGSATIAIGQDVATSATPTFAGMTLTGNLTMGNGTTNHNVVNVLDPVNPQDAATKSYVDAQSAGSLGGAVILAPATSTRNLVARTADATALTLKAFTTQTNPLLNVTSNGGSSVASISGTGAITGASLNTGSGTIQTTGTVQGGAVTGTTVTGTTVSGATVSVSGALTGAGAGKYAGVVNVATVSTVVINVPDITATSAIILTFESATGGPGQYFVSGRDTIAKTFTVAFTSVTPANGKLNYLVIN
jgi:hypothetical protein